MTDIILGGAILTFSIGVTVYIKNNRDKIIKKYLKKFSNK
jgi:hypothetical protein